MGKSSKADRESTDLVEVLSPGAYCNFEPVKTLRGNYQAHDPIMPWWDRTKEFSEFHLEDQSQILLPYTPSAIALRFHNSTARHRILLWGVRSGKSQAGASEMVRAALAQPDGLSWVVSPTYSQLEVAEDCVLGLLRNRDDLLVRRNQNKRVMEMYNGHRIYFKSADISNNLRGPTVTGLLWVDEAAFVKQESWYICRQRVSTSEAPIIFTTTPNGRNWVWEDCQSGGLPYDAKYQSYRDFTSKTEKLKALEEKVKASRRIKLNEEIEVRPEEKKTLDDAWNKVLTESGYGEFEKGDFWVSHYPTWFFPWVPKNEFVKVKKTMPRVVWLQEYGAQFKSGSSMVFNNLFKASSYEPLPAEAKEIRNIMGFDLAKAQDFSVPLIMTGRGRVAHLERWNGMDWSIQREKAAAMAKDWNAIIVIDKANMGQVIAEDLEKMGLQIHAIDTNSAQVKTELIQTLQVSFEHKYISIPDVKSQYSCPDMIYLWKELRAYEYKLTPHGRISYSAPKNQHDDCVIAMALANYGRVRGFAGTREVVSYAMDMDDLDPKEMDDGFRNMNRPLVNQMPGSGSNSVFGRASRKMERNRWARIF